MNESDKQVYQGDSLLKADSTFSVKPNDWYAVTAHDGCNECWRLCGAEFSRGTCGMIQCFPVSIFKW